MQVAAVSGVTPPVDLDFAEFREYERAGCYDAVFLPDDPEMLDIYATIAAAGPATERIRFGTGVSDVIRRHPVVLANQAMTLDHLTGGRLILGLGSGKDENLLPYGFDFGRPVARLTEAITVLRTLWESTEPVDFDGEFYRLRAAECPSLPYTAGGPPLWLGAHGPRTQRLVGAVADGWLPSLLPLDKYADGMAQIDKAARDVGRDPATITRALFPVVALTDIPGQDVAAELGYDERAQASAIVGTVDEVETRLREYEELGCEYLVLANMTKFAYPNQAANAGRLLDTLAGRLTA